MALKLNSERDCGVKNADNFVMMKDPDICSATALFLL